MYFGQRNFKEALNMYGKAKEIQEKFLDKNNLDVSETFNNIGVTKCLQGEYDEALEWCHKAKNRWRIARFAASTFKLYV